MRHTVEPILRRVVEVCRELGLEYYVTGSIASMYYGEPRFTQDVDIVVALISSRIRRFCESFPEPDFYVSLEAATDAALHGGCFNIIHSSEGVKADIVIPRDTPFEASKFSRARREPLTPDCEAVVSSPEDLILAKLLFYREGQSDKHLRDIASMFRSGRVELDRAYVDAWAKKLGITDEWRLMQDHLRGVPGPPSTNPG